MLRFKTCIYCAIFIHFAIKYTYLEKGLEKQSALFQLEKMLEHSSLLSKNSDGHRDQSAQVLYSPLTLLASQIKYFLVN